MNVSNFVDMIGHLKPKSDSADISHSIRFVSNNKVYDVKLFSVLPNGEVLIQLKDKEDCKLKNVSD